MSTSQSELEKFSAKDEHGTLYSASIQIALYAHRPLAELTSGVVACYDVFLKHFGKEVTYYHASNMRTSRAFSAKYAEVLPTLLQKKGAALPRYKLYKADGMMDFRPPLFRTEPYANHSTLQVQLPTEAAVDPEALVALTTELGTLFPFRCGHVGYSLCWDDGMASRAMQVPKHIAPLFKRYPGFAWGEPSLLADHPLPPVNWLTLLGPDVVEKLGGPEKLRTDLKDDAIKVTPLGAGVCIRAGEAPQLGDVDRGDNLPLYRKVGAYLKDLRGSEYLELDGFNDEHDSGAWLARFDA